MSDQYLTLKDITAWDNTDDVVGLVENIINVAPELDVVMGRPIKGISYRARVRTAIAANAAFRKANSGVSLSASSYDRKRFNCFPFDVQMRIDEAELIEGQSEGDLPGKIITEETVGAMRAKALVVGKQFYQGTLNDPLGCPGLIDFLTTARTQVDSRTGKKIDQTIDAGGTTVGACEIIWFIKQGPQGVHWLFGNGKGITMNPPMWQQVTAADNSGKNRSLCFNLFGYLGTSMANYHAVGAIINVDVTNGTTTANGLWDDKSVAKLWAKFPITEKPDMCLCTQNAAAALQQQRAVTNFAQNGENSGTGRIAPIGLFPTNLPTAGNIPIVVTDSIQLGNQTVLS